LGSPGVSARNQQHGLPVVQTNTIGMAYGRLCMLVVAAFSGTPFNIELTSSCLLSLGCLALFGSAIACGCDLSLVGRIGPGQAPVH